MGSDYVGGVDANRLVALVVNRDRMTYVLIRELVDKRWKKVDGHSRQ